VAFEIGLLRRSSDLFERVQLDNHNRQRFLVSYKKNQGSERRKST